jgi:hypothetical protein
VLDHEVVLFVSLRNLLIVCVVGVLIVLMMMRSKKVFTFIFLLFDEGAKKKS